MRQYRPTIEQLKKRYSADMARRKMISKWESSRPPGYKKVQIPDNSEPWLPHLPRSLAECRWISDQISNRVGEWKKEFLPTDS